MSKVAPAIGIDLGTTFSCVAVVKDNEVKVIHGDDGRHITASWVHFADDWQSSVGNAAKDKSAKNVYASIFGVKRFIGRTYDEFKKQSSNVMYPYKVENKDGRPSICVSQNVNSRDTRSYSPEQISGMVLEKMKNLAEDHLGEKVTKAVITVPAHFNGTQREATKLAGKLAGLEVLQIINEPTAAALAFQMDNANAYKTVLVYDFGGGTFDVSIVTIKNGIIDVKASNGDAYLGGDDIDLKLAKHFMEDFKKQTGINIMDGSDSKMKAAFRRFLSKAEQVKIRLTDSNSVDIELDYIYKELSYDSTMSRAQFENINEELFSKTLKLVEQSLKDAKLGKSAIDEIVMVGGTTRIPLVRDMVKSYFNKKINVSVNPDEAVAKGAARRAAMLDGTRSKLVECVKLTDVSSLSLGTNVIGGIMSVIIPRNTKLPAKKTCNYYTTVDNQTRFTFYVLEGERKMVADNKKLGEFTVNGIKLAPRGETSAAVTFELDENGILNATAVEKDGPNTKSITLDIHKDYYTQDQIDNMIAQAEMFRQEDEQRKKDALVKIELQDYCYDTIKKIRNMRGMSEVDKAAVTKTCGDTLEWISGSKGASITEIKHKKTQVSKTCDAILKKYPK